MCSVAEFETLSTAESMWFPGVSLSDVSVSFRCFDWMAILFVCSGYILSSARGTENFIIISHRYGNQRKFTSMFICASLPHPCVSVACFYTEFQVLLTVLIMHSSFREHPVISHTKITSCIPSLFHNFIVFF